MSRKIELLAEAQNHRCASCGEPLLWDAPDHNHPLRPSVHEIKPRSRGGERTWDNQVATHRRCNTLRGSRNALTFYERRGWEARL